MTDATGGFFQGNGIELSNPINREEEEELEEQRRRQEELTDLLATGINAFTYDESTLNSSSASCDAPEAKKKDSIPIAQFEPSNMYNKLSDASLEDNYKNVDAQNQLKLLYEVRMREISTLKQEFEDYKQEKSKEISVLKNKCTLGEAEIRHLQLSSRNLEDLLVEKTETINNLRNNLSTRDQEILSLKKHVEELKDEICAYSSTVNELHLKLATSNPFHAEKQNAGTVEKTHQDQMFKLESLLDGQAKKIQVLEKENTSLKEELKKVVKNKKECDDENDVMIMELSKKLQSSQQQCRDLFVLGEAIKKESDHFRERLLQAESKQMDLSSETLAVKSKDKDTLLVFIEKLKRMILDKELHLNTLQSKLKFYETDLEELFEYRRLLNDIYNCEFKSCGNLEHSELLVFMQRQIQSYQQAVEDRNQQILSLNSVNKELREKIEEMLKETRSNLQNLSEKYSLPQLETMNKELNKAQGRIYELEKQLSEKQSLQDSDKEALLVKLEELRKEKDALTQLSENEKHNFEVILDAIKQNLKKSEEEITRLRDQLRHLEKSELNLKEENTKINFQLQEMRMKYENCQSDNEVKDLREKYGQVQEQLHKVVLQLERVGGGGDQGVNMKPLLRLKKKMEKVLGKNSGFKKSEILVQMREWDDILNDYLGNQNNVSDCTLNKEMELRESIQDLTNAKTMLEGEKFTLECQIESLTNQVEEARGEISLLKQKLQTLNIENEKNVEKMKNELSNYKTKLERLEMEKSELEEELQIAQKQQSEGTFKVNGNIRRNLFVNTDVGERNEAEKHVLDSEAFQKCLQAEILKTELLVHEQMQEENAKSLQKIEEKYRNMVAKKSEQLNREKGKWDKRDADSRQQFAAVLDECSKKISELEGENVELSKKNSAIIKECGVYETQVRAAVEQHTRVIAEYKNKLEITISGWKNLLHFCISNYASMGKQTQKEIRNVITKINRNQDQIYLVEKIYEEKIKNFKTSGKIRKY